MKEKYLLYLLLTMLYCSCFNEVPHDDYFDYLKEDYEDGTPKMRAYWKDKEKKLVETVLYTKDQEKDLVCQMYLKDNLPGFCRKFYENDDIKYYSLIEDNMYNGPYFEFHPNEVLKVRGSYLNDKKNGEFLFYNDRSELEAIAHYIDDKQYLLKEYYEDSTNFSLKVHVCCPDSLKRSERYFEVDFFIPYIDSLSEFRDSIFINQDLYYQEEIESNKIHSPRFKDHLERGWKRIHYDKKSDTDLIVDTAIYLSGFLYKMTDENLIDTLDIIDPIKIKIVDD